MSSLDITANATLIATAVTALATGVLAWFTWIMAGATKRMAEATQAPSVVVSIEPSRWSLIHVDLITENTGNATAFDIDVRFTIPLKRDGNGTEVITPRISVLRPGYPLRNFIGGFHDFSKVKHEVTVSWAVKPGANQRQSMTYFIDLASFQEMHFLGSGDPSIAAASELKKIREGLTRLGSTTNRFQVDTKTPADHTREYAAFEARHKKQRAVKEVKEE